MAPPPLADPLKSVETPMSQLSETWSDVQRRSAGGVGDGDGDDSDDGGSFRLGATAGPAVDPETGEDLLAALVAARVEVTRLRQDLAGAREEIARLNEAAKRPWLAPSTRRLVVEKHLLAARLKAVEATLRAERDEVQPTKVALYTKCAERRRCLIFPDSARARAELNPASSKATRRIALVLPRRRDGAEAHGARVGDRAAQARSAPPTRDAPRARAKARRAHG